MPIRFVLVGGLNTLVALLVFATLNRTFSDHRIAGFAAVPICILISHATMGRFVFARRDIQTLPAFVLVYTVLGALNAGIIAQLANLGYAPLVGQLVALPIIAVLSYVANRFLVFRQVQ